MDKNAILSFHETVHRQSNDKRQKNMKPIFIAGPCVIESASLLDEVAARIVDINNQLGTDIIFKASFDKANRTSVSSFRGP